MTNKEEVIEHLILLKESAVKSDNDTEIISVKLDSFNFVMDMAIKALEYDDAKYHEEHGEVIVDKAVWEDAKKALEQEPKTGHWIHYEGMLICSECGTEFYDDIMEYCGDDVPKCCPDCGRRMFEPQERSK